MSVETGRRRDPGRYRPPPRSPQNFGQSGIALLTSLQDLVASASAIDAHTESLTSLVDIIDDPMVDARRLVPIVESDPGLTAALLKLCNSSMYNFQRRIGSPREALVLVGNLTFARLCFALSLEPVLRRDLPGYGLDLDGLWKHSLTTAYGAASLVRAMGQSELRDRAFTAGLLHDIGKLVLDPELDRLGTGSVDEEEAAESGDIPDVGGLTTHQERRLTGYDHAEAGAALLEQWDLPEQTISAVRWHHEPERAGAHEALAHALFVAEKVSGFAEEEDMDERSMEEWLIGTFDPDLVPLEPIRHLMDSVSAKRQNILALAAGPIG